MDNNRLLGLGKIHSDGAQKTDLLDFTLKF